MHSCSLVAWKSTVAKLLINGSTSMIFGNQMLIPLLQTTLTKPLNIEWHIRYMDNRFDPRIFELIPHRPPMMLINRVVNVDVSDASALVFIDEQTPFYQPEKGVPAWVGIEYMGQTAALIAGYRLEQRLIEPHMGFLIGTRAYQSECSYFEPDTRLQVTSKESAMVADGFTKFDCVIENVNTTTGNRTILVQSSLSVFRRPLHERD